MPPPRAVALLPIEGRAGGELVLVEGRAGGELLTVEGRAGGGCESVTLGARDDRCGDKREVNMGASGSDAEEEAYAWRSDAEKLPFDSEAEKAIGAGMSAPRSCLSPPGVRLDLPMAGVPSRLSAEAWSPADVLTLILLIESPADTLRLSSAA
mmetsp:Transcript_25810/g.81611  ORF Transcript_25810/g.81611 Transcript_25810/m.81611 type:complete len:153 (+) Transcript_25810:280-738(+)